MSQTANSFHLRMPPRLKDQLELARAENGTSLNKEIIDRLDRSLAPDLAGRLADAARPYLTNLEEAAAKELVAHILGMLKIASKGAKPRKTRLR